VSEKLVIGYSAANQQVRRLVAEGLLVKLGRARYSKAVTSASVEPEMCSPTSTTVPRRIEDAETERFIEIIRGVSTGYKPARKTLVRAWNLVQTFADTRGYTISDTDVHNWAIAMAEWRLNVRRRHRRNAMVRLLRNALFDIGERAGDHGNWDSFCRGAYGVWKRRDNRFLHFTSAMEIYLAYVQEIDELSPDELEDAFIQIENSRIRMRSLDALRRAIIMAVEQLHSERHGIREQQAA
jgi:hypothetical protein